MQFTVLVTIPAAKECIKNTQTKIPEENSPNSKYSEIYANSSKKKKEYDLIILLLTWAILQSTSWFGWLNGVKIKLLFQRPRGAVVWIIFASHFPPDIFFKTFYSTLDTTSCVSRVFVANKCQWLYRDIDTTRFWYVQLHHSYGEEHNRCLI